MTKVSGQTGDARLQRIVHRVVSDLFRTIEDRDVRSDRFRVVASKVPALESAQQFLHSF